MKAEEKLLERLNQLLELGQEVLASERVMEYSKGSLAIPTCDYFDDSLVSKWITSTLSFFKRTFGEDSECYRRFEKEVGKCTWKKNVSIGIGIISSAIDEVEGGWLFETKALIQADVFADFLEQATHLLENKYHGPAAVIAGVVLEDGLRKLCDQNGITLPSKPKIDSMNAELAKKGIYNKKKQKQITTLADIRNNAAHGKWDQFNEDDVRRMIEEVGTLMADLFS